MNISTLLQMAEFGTHPACKTCPWNPLYEKNAAFGVSCKKHGVDWKTPQKAISLLVAQDPAGTTPQKTGNLCGVCNAQYSTDHSAQHGYALWKAAVSLADSGQTVSEYMKRHYWTNAIMHGVKDDKRYKDARACCKNILLEQINLLSPKIIIATGKVAIESLLDLKLISNKWDDFKILLARQAYSEKVVLPSGGESIIFCTFHASATSVNTHVARLFSEETMILLDETINRLPHPYPAQQFLKRYQGFSGEDKGMKVLLLHWLNIGEAIRKANTLYESSE